MNHGIYPYFGFWILLGTTTEWLQMRPIHLMTGIFGVLFHPIEVYVLVVGQGWAPLVYSELTLCELNAI